MKGELEELLRYEEKLNRTYRHPRLGAVGAGKLLYKFTPKEAEWRLTTDKYPNRPLFSWEIKILTFIARAPRKEVAKFKILLRLKIGD